MTTPDQLQRALDIFDGCFCRVNNDSDHEYNFREEEVKTIRAVLEAALQHTGDRWLPIETAAKDEQILAVLRGCDTGSLRYAVIEWSQYGWLFDGSEISNAWDIVKWQPLPPPPKETNDD